ncbi:MAG: anion permease [Candidatus Magnetominusculus sp. LBB02]|nr:anion permease [Candidatus Magnetominusculus sp. LBB02]
MRSSYEQPPLEGQAGLICSYLLKDEIFSSINKKEIAHLLPHITLRTFENGQTIFSKGQHAEFLYMLISGQVRLFSDIASVTVGCGGRFGVESCSGLTHYVTCVTALEAAEAIAIPAEKVLQLIKGNSQIKGSFTLSMIESFIGGDVTVEKELAGQGVERRQTKRKVLSTRAAGWTSVIVLFPLALWLGYKSGLDSNAVFFLGTMTAVVLMWVFKLVDEFIPGLFAVLAFLCIGVAPADVVLSGFTSDGFFLAMSVLGLGTVIVISGLSYRIILLLILKLPKTQTFLNLILMLTGIVLTPIIPTANGRVAMLSPFLRDIVETCKLTRGKRAATRLAFSTFSGTTLLSGIFLTSKSVNFVVLGMMPPQVQEEFQWLPWFLASIVTGAVVLVAVYAATALMLRNSEPIQISTEQIRIQLWLLGRLTAPEWSAIAGIVFFVIGIATYSFHKIQPSWVGLSILYGLLLFGSLKKEDFREKVDWPFLVYLASVVGIIQTMKAVGLDSVVARHLSMLIPYMSYDFGVFVMMLAGIMFVLRLAMPINAAIVLMAAVLMPLADVAGLNSWLVGFIILFLGEMWAAPYQCSYYMQFQGLALTDNTYDEREFLRLNMISNIIKLAAVYASVPYWRLQGIL